jgi:hypothetical protein
MGRGRLYGRKRTSCSRRLSVIVTLTVETVVALGGSNVLTSFLVGTMQHDGVWTMRCVSASDAT